MSETVQDTDTPRASDSPRAQPPVAARSSRRSWWRVPLTLLLQAVLVLLLAILWVLGTQSGLRFSLSLAEELAPDRFRVERVDGRILGDLHIEGLSVRTPGLALRLGSLDLRWSPLTTLTGTLPISELSVRELDIATAPAEDEDKEKKSGPIELPRILLPIRIELEQALVEHLGIGTLHDDSRLRVDRIALAASCSGSTLTLKRLTLVLPEPRLRADAQGEVELTGDYPVALGLTWNLSREPALELAGAAAIGGDLEALRVEHDLTGAARVELRALVREVLKHPRWKGELDILGVDLPSLHPDLPALDMQGSLTTNGDMDDARIQGNLAGEAPDLPGSGRFQARLDIGWRDRVLDIAALELTDDKSGALFTAGGKLDLSNPGGRVDLDAVWEKLRWPLAGEPVAEIGQGKLHVQGTLDKFGYRLSSEVWGPDLPAAKLRLTGEGNREAARIEDLRIDTLDGKIEAKGRGAWSPEPSWELTLVADGINPGAQWPELPARIGLELTSQGDLDAFTYNLKAGMESKALPPATLEIEGQGNGEGTRIENLRLNTLGGHLHATADVAWKPSVTWENAELTIADIDPGRQWPEWDGVLGGRILSEGKLADGGPDLRARIESLAGKLRGYPVDAVGGIRMQGTELRIDELRIASGLSNLRATGSVGERLDLVLNLYSPDLESLLPKVQGSLRANGILTGTLAAPVVKLGLAAGDIAVAKQRIRSLLGTVQVDLAPGGRVKIDLTGQNLVAGGITFDDLRILGKGDMGTHRLSAQVTGAPVALDLEVRGGLREDYAYAGRLTGLALRTREFGNWRLRKAAPITLAGARIGAGPICIREEAGSGGCASFAQQEPGNWNATLDLDRLAFELFKDLIPEDLTLKGKATAKADFKAVGGTLTGNAGVRIPEGVLGILHGKDGSEPLNFTSANLAIDADGKGLRAKLAVPLKGLGNLSADVALPGWSLDKPARPNQPLAGGMQGRIDNLGLVSRLVPDITRLTGNLKADFKLGGTLAEPGLRGSAGLADGGLEVPFIGLKIEDLTFDATAKNFDRIEYSGGFKAGKGRLEITGHTLSGTDGPRTRISAKGSNRLTLADSKEYYVRASPDIRVEIGPTGTKVTGKVRVPRARIRPRHIPAGTVSPSPDVVVAAKGQKEKTSATSIDLRLVLGKKVTIDAFGLEGTIRGELAVLQEPGKELLGDGQLEIVDGTYRISFVVGLSAMVGEPLTIKQGYLNYAKSPINNPHLVLTAQREGGDITAGLRVFGTIRNPKLTFFSATDPGMSQSEITKYLLTGIPPNSEGLQDQTVSFGTYVAPRLFVEYDYSLGNEPDKIKLRYDLNDRIELQTETGDAQGGDIFYTFED